MFHPVTKHLLLLMHRSFWLPFLAFVTFLSACANLSSRRVDRRDFAIDVYYPASNEIQRAESHARQYWRENAERLRTGPRYLAVTVSALLAAELNAEFSIKLDRSETSGAYFTQGISSSSKQGVYGVLIYDTQTGRAVGPQGYIIIDTPSRGQVVRVADYVARYIGAGK